MGEGDIAEITGNEKVAKVTQAAEAWESIDGDGDVRLQELSGLGAKL